MYWDEHPPPQFHAKYGEFEAQVSIETLELSLFNQVFVDDGVVTWPGGLGLAPDTMHEELGKAGVYAIR